MVDGFCEYCRVSDADTVYAGDERHVRLDCTPEQTVLCSDSSSPLPDDRLYESDRYGFDDTYVLNRSDQLVDFLSVDDVVSRLYVVSFMVFVVWLSFLVTIVLIVLLF